MISDSNALEIALNVTIRTRVLAVFLVFAAIYILNPLRVQREQPVEIILSATTRTSTFPVLVFRENPLKTSSSNDTPVRVAVVVSLAKQTSHIAEFHLLYDSWRFLQNFFPLSQQVLVDLIVFCEQPSCSQLPSACLPLTYNKHSLLISACFHEVLPHAIINEWQDYLYMTSIAFLLTPEYRRTSTKYDWILRVDQDAVLSPGLLLGVLRRHPIGLYEMQFGGVGHGTVFTHERLRSIASKLGYIHVGIYNLCSTWLVHPNDSIILANLTTVIGRHFLQHEFGRNVSGKRPRRCGAR